MKRASLLLIAISLLFASCNKDPEWVRFHGFTQADIVGHYEANPDESLYEDYPTEGVAIYDNASMDVVAEGSNGVTVHIVIPDKINKTYSGSINMTEENYTELIIYNYHDDLIMTAYKNDKGQVRFHGRVKLYAPNTFSIQHDTNLYFDVIKE